MTHTKYMWSFDKKTTFKISPDTLLTHHFTSTDSIKTYSEHKRALIIHKIIVSEVKKILIPNTKFSDIINISQSTLNHLAKFSDIGFAFPIGISVNEIVVHDSYYSGDTRYLKRGDVVKIDIGIHVNGNIIDDAFTQEIETHNQDKLIKATEDATYTCIALCGVDARLYELSENIKEVIESYDVKACEGIGGHNIKNYQVHGGKLILSVPDKIQETMKMEDGEFYGIETFASTGTGKLRQLKDIPFTHYLHGVKKSKNKLTKWAINHKLPFSPIMCPEFTEFHENLICGNLQAFPPLSDIVGSYTSQLEHTICVNEKQVEIFF